jgi:hypothetical protein
MENRKGGPCCGNYILYIKECLYKNRSTKKPKQRKKL